ncbi:MAG: hypothetical protein ACOX4R_03555 [Lentihominibacter sp.]|jgi:hypothetical protein
MDRYLSLMFLYNRAGYKKFLLIIAAIPLCFLLLFLVRVGIPSEASSYMLVERAFGGAWGILILIAVNLIGYTVMVNALNGKKSLKISHSIPGYTLRRLCISPLSTYFTIFIYYLVVILIFWGVAIASLYAIGKISLTMAGATGIPTKLALGLLRTEIGAALIPLANPVVIMFDIVAVLAMAGECARSCYLGWHNGAPSAGILLIAALMFIVWSFDLNTSTKLLIAVMTAVYALLPIGDVIFREKRPKGDPFIVNKYSGIIDMDSVDFDEDVRLEANRALYEEWSPETSILNQYGRIKDRGRIDIGLMRRRFMPIGSNMEKANFLFGLCICLGVGEHLLFFAKYIMEMRVIARSIKGVTIEPGVAMPYFWELQNHTLYGYFAAILLVFIVQAYWNYSYYNKETKSVYVMKRLPDRKEYARTIWVTPLIEALVIAVIMIGNIFIDYGIYTIFTPDVAILGGTS